MSASAGVTRLTSDELKQRVISNTGEDGHLKNKAFDLDARTVAILGKRHQISKNFGFTSMLSFSTTVLVSWEAFAVTFQGGLVNGGPSTLVYGLIFSFFGSLATAASLAEMASISPTSGGQYHWVALLAPHKYAISFSWFAGWITAFMRIAVTASVAFLAATMIQGLIILNYPDTYTPEQWHGTLMYWAVTLVIVFINIFGIRFLPHIETLALILHVSFFFCILVPLVHLAPRSSSEFVFKSFANNGGWKSDGVSWCIGLLTSTYAFSGVDGASHMAEEVDNAAIVVPQTMIWSIIVSGVLCFGMSIAILFSIGDVTAALETPTGFPIIEIFFNATKSYAATNAMVSALIISIFFSALGLLASGSRLIWAFARDDGMPFPHYFSHVDARFGIPVRAILWSAVLIALLGLINLGSTTAFNAMVSLALLGQYSTYVLPTIFILARRIHPGKNIPFGPWELGKWGIPINIFTIAFSFLTIAFNVLPPYFPVTAVNMNYAGVVFGVALIICGLLWLLRGKRHYAGPIREVMENGNVRSALLNCEIEPAHNREVHDTDKVA
ncbi:putative amino acid permease [Lindgomyces ingoldianus]|uniref:Amino acid permease n=1 Tax=Lindgomyces ingoldianus TaxID=673940 RepID=A0ACB6QCU3_9PLEO|nr:putative amino acid permease [Lindgomyces ingoldianus]KAF2463971.1 putative amino acid permease [Lindgomyces ingoldianus]